jgi:hypothetical protein
LCQWPGPASAWGQGLPSLWSGPARASGQGLPMPAARVRLWRVSACGEELQADCSGQRSHLLPPRATFFSPAGNGPMARSGRGADRPNDDASRGWRGTNHTGYSSPSSKMYSGAVCLLDCQLGWRGQGSPRAAGGRDASSSPTSTTHFHFISMSHFSIVPCGQLETVRR